MPDKRIDYTYRVKQGAQIFTVPAADEVIIDLSKIEYHIFAFRVVNTNKSVPVEVKGWGGIFLASSGGGESPTSLIKFYNAPDLRMKRCDVIRIGNSSAVNEGSVVLVYEFLDFD